MNVEEEKLATLQKELSDLIRERELASLLSIGPDPEARIWHTARLQIIEKKINKLRNKIFVVQNAK